MNVNYTLHIYLTSRGKMDGYFECSACHLCHFLDEALEEGETVTTDETGTIWSCPICGGNKDKAKSLKLSMQAQADAYREAKQH